MSINSKQKGARAERAVAKILKEHGFTARRTAQYCGKTGDAADVVGLDGFHIEVKHQETTKIWDWIKQAERDCKDGDIPIVVYRKNNKQWQVTMSFENFLKLIPTRLTVSLPEDININGLLPFEDTDFM